ncbi:MAG: adenylyl-sulfate kinase [Candidatus Eisenbacteria bacterium]
MAKKGFTLWFTGMSGSGKSTLAEAVQGMLLERGINTEILDGDVIRTNLSKGLGFSQEDRDINIRRVGFVCHLLTRNDAVAIAACISPYKAIRDENREMIGRFVEVYCKAPLEKLIERDPKGLYKKALAGEIKGFTGIDDPYEEPVKPEVVVNTAEETIEESSGKILRTLELMNYIPASDTEGEYSEEEEEEIKKRLADLGYI